MTTFQEALLAWTDAGGGWRDLPWRRTRDPWAVLVSEVMLQQTQVARVVPRWAEFLARFPNPVSCAAAPVAEVIGCWAGLGYNRRAVQLHRAAVAVVELHGGRLPSTLAELRSLPGIGPYTARAVLAFAFEDAVGVVDTNVARVLARAVAGRRLSAREAQEAADAVVPGPPSGRSWRWNQAMLDLGAGHCAALARCDGCPLRQAGCAWAAAGFVSPDPAVGSALVSGRQSRFAGSDRQGRGRLVRALRAGPLTRESWPGAAGWPGDAARAERAAISLVDDGLAVLVGEALSLP
ncbi:MAG: A/G-specific adenine glycosylase [Acidimicrobiales bacterium]